MMVLSKTGTVFGDRWGTCECLGANCSETVFSCLLAVSHNLPIVVVVKQCL
jgi:hypothetical protein